MFDIGERTLKRMVALSKGYHLFSIGGSRKFDLAPLTRWRQRKSPDIKHRLDCNLTAHLEAVDGSRLENVGSGFRASCKISTGNEPELPRPSCFNLSLATSRSMKALEMLSRKAASFWL